MSWPRTPLTSRSGHVRGRKRINAHPIEVLRLANPKPYLLEMAKIDNAESISAIGQGLDPKDNSERDCLKCKGS